MNSKILFVALFTLAVGLLLGYYLGYDHGFEKVSTASIDSVENLGNENELSDQIIVNSPRPTESISSPLIVTGQARGSWYFEASFPVYLYDADGVELAVKSAQAQGEWMTEDFVPFEVTLTFGAPGTAMGTLVLKKDNPSGLPEHDAELTIPVIFQEEE